MIIMKGSVMENGICLSDAVAEIIDNRENLKCALQKFCNLVNEKYSASISICEIFGKRWSFIAGSKASYNAKIRVEINSSYGLVYEKDTLSPVQLRNVVKLVRKIIKERNK